MPKVNFTNQVTFTDHTESEVTVGHWNHVEEDQEYVFLKVADNAGGSQTVLLDPETAEKLANALKLLAGTTGIRILSF